MGDDRGEVGLVGIGIIVLIAEEDARGRLEDTLAVPTRRILLDPLKLNFGVGDDENTLRPRFANSQDFSEELRDLPPIYMFQTVLTENPVPLLSLYRPVRLLEVYDEVDFLPLPTVHIDFTSWVRIVPSTQFDDTRTGGNV